MQALLSIKKRSLAFANSSHDPPELPAVAHLLSSITRNAHTLRNSPLCKSFTGKRWPHRQNLVPLASSLSLPPLPDSSRHPPSSQLLAHPVPAELLSQPLLHFQPPTTPTFALQPNNTAASPQALPPQSSLRDLPTSPSRLICSPPSNITRPAKRLRKNNPFCYHLSDTVASVVSSVHSQLQPQPRSYPQSHSHFEEPPEAVIRLEIVLAARLFLPATLTSLSEPGFYFLACQRHSLVNTYSPPSGQPYVKVSNLPYRRA